MNNAFLGVAISMVLIFAILASAATAVTEGISRFLGLRAEYLLRGLRTLLVQNNTFKLSLRPGKKAPAGAEGKSATLRAILAEPAIEATGPKGGMADAGNAPLSSSERRNLPSYVSGRAFSRAVIDVALPNAAGLTTLQEFENQLAQNQALAADDPKHLDDRLYKLLLNLLRETNGDINRVRTRLENVYDEHMKRVSGWYKRHVRWITIGAGAALVLLLNLNAVRVASALYLDEPLRAAVVAQAQKPAQCDATSPGDCLDKVRAAVQPLAAAGLPIGWTAVPDCAGSTHCSWWARYGITTPTRSSTGHNLLHVLVALLGYVLMALAVLPGARFWYSALDRLNVFRSSGARPAESPTAASNAS
jgi:hypothetical protein